MGINKRIIGKILTSQLSTLSTAELCYIASLPTPKDVQTSILELSPGIFTLEDAARFHIWAINLYKKHCVRLASASDYGFLGIPTCQIS